MIKSSPQLRFIAVILCLGVISSIAMLSWSKFQGMKLSGADQISVLDENIYIHMNKKLYHLSSKGEFIRSIDLSSLGIEGAPSDIQVMRDGDMLIGDKKRKNIRKCDLKSLTCSVIGPTGGISLSNPFKFFTNEAQDELYIVDTWSHRLIVQDIGGQGTDVLVGSEFKYPNDIKVGKDSLLYIADTNKHRIAVLERNGTSVREAGDQFRVKNKYGRTGRRWPVALAQSPIGDWWVLNADSMMKDADLIVYSGEGKPIRRATLPDNADPIDIAWSGEQLIYTDFSDNQVYSLQPDTDAFAPFGDATFQAEVKHFSELKSAYRGHTGTAFNIFYIAVGLSLAVGISMLKSSGKRQHNKARPVPSPAVGTTHTYDHNRNNRTVLKDEEKKALQKRMQVNWIIWAAMFLTLGFYVLICHLYEHDLKGIANIGDTYHTLKNTFFVIILLELGGIHYIRKIILAAPSKEQHSLFAKLNTDPGYNTPTGRYSAALVISLAIAESIAIYGLILFILGGDFQTLYIFHAISAIAMIVYRPKMEELEKLAVALNAYKE